MPSTSAGYLRVSVPQAPPNMSGEPGEEPKDVTSNEEKELRRVFDYLANFSPKYKLRRRMQPLLDRRQKIMQFKRNPDAIRIVDEAGVELTPEQLEKELEHIEAEIATLKAQVDEIDADAAKKIHCVDLMDALHSLGKDSTKVTNEQGGRGWGRRGVRSGGGPFPGPDPPTAAPPLRAAFSSKCCWCACACRSGGGGGPVGMGPSPCGNTSPPPPSPAPAPPSRVTPPAGRASAKWRI
jgi:hypothetical protein